MRYWNWRVYAVLAAILLGFAGGRLSVGIDGWLTAAALFGGLFQASNAAFQYRRPR
ncbi:MAG: hypothetical protein AB7I50_00735 [Vicinamibacterales bacterium]